jgi:hypothetical protein
MDAYHSLASFSIGYGGQSNPSVPNMAKRWGVSESSIRRGLAECKARKLIRITERRHEGRNGQLSNEYELLPVPGSRKRDPL